jgi:hypothetical protein
VRGLVWQKKTEYIRESIKGKISFKKNVALIQSQANGERVSLVTGVNNMIPLKKGD